MTHERLQPRRGHRDVGATARQFGGPGAFGKLGKLGDTLQEGDRVEIYRPLIADPKEVRKQRAAQGKVTKKGAGSQSG